MTRHEKALAILHAGTLIPAVPLALNAARKLDEAAQRRLVRYYLRAGAGGLAVAVHTTQFAIREKQVGLLRPVLEIAAEEMARFEEETGKTPVRVAGVCGPVEQAVAEARLAKELGYDAVLLSPGGLAGNTEEQLVLRTAVVSAVLPVIGFYLQSSVGGRRLSFDYWRAVADTENVVALKAAPFNRYGTIDLVRGVAFSKRREQIALYTGNDDNIVSDLLAVYRFTVEGKPVKLRFAGGLLGHWAVWTHTAVRLFEEILAVREREEIPAGLLAIASEVTDANGAVFDVNNGFAGCIAGVHEVLRRQGLLQGIWCLDPNETLSPGQAEELDRVCRAYPHLCDDAFVRGFLQEEGNRP